MSTSDLVLGKTELPLDPTRAESPDGRLVAAGSNPLVLVGTVITVLLVLLGVLAPWIAPHDYTEQNLLARSRLLSRRAIFSAPTSSDATL